MRPASELTRELIASGLTPAQTALLMELVLSMSCGSAAVKPVESPAYRTLEKRRAWDRDRKAREREDARLSALSTGHQVESGGMSTGQGKLHCEVEDKEEGLSVGRERKKGNRLTEDARVSDESRAFAVSAGIPPDRVDAEWTEFIDYWIGVPGSRGCKVNWPATWRNRVRQIAPKYRNRNAASPLRTDTPAGRATAREAEFVAAVGGGALRVLEEERAARSARQTPGSPDVTGRPDPRGRAENAG